MRNQIKQNISSSVIAGVVVAVTITLLLGNPFHNRRVSKKEFDENYKFAMSLEVGDCFRSEKYSEPEFSFEKPHLYIDHVHMVMAIDREKAALLIAQPDPNCNANYDESHKCEYWFRAHLRRSGFLITGNEQKVECPKKLQYRDMLRKFNDGQYYKKFTIKD